MPRVGLNFLGIFVARLGRPENAPLVREACLPILSSFGADKICARYPRSRESLVGGAHYLICPGLPMKGTTPWDAMLFSRSGNRLLPGLVCGSQALL